MDYLPNEARLFIHSQGSLSEKMPQLSSLIDRLLKEDKLDVYEETVTAPGLYKRGDVYVYPSRLDGIGLSVPEALASGLPVITTDSPPMNEFVVPGGNGRVIKIDKLVARADGYYWPQALIDQKSLRDEMAYYVKNFESLAQFKAEARQYAENKLDWSRNASGLANQIGAVTKDLNLNWNMFTLRFSNMKHTPPFNKSIQNFLLAHKVDQAIPARASLDNYK
ncbi:MAG: glycosyltransferase [Chloroflexi bacterium]|nr:glycosyltransferase [Chloroflexota bacterium]